MITEVRVGPQVTADGATIVGRGGKSGEVTVADAHARYQEAVYRGNVFTAANTATQALSLNSTATATGLILSNPAASGKNLVLLEITSYISAAVTAVANVVLAANVNPVAAAVTHTTPITPRNALLGGATGVGLVDSSATLPAVPTIIRSLFGWHWVTGGTPTTQLGVKDEVAGAIVLGPGTSVNICSVTVAHSCISSFTWEEIPV